MIRDKKLEHLREECSKLISEENLVLIEKELLKKLITHYKKKGNNRQTIMKLRCF